MPVLFKVKCPTLSLCFCEILTFCFKVAESSVSRTGRAVWFVSLPHSLGFKLHFVDAIALPNCRLHFVDAISLPNLLSNLPESPFSRLNFSRT